LSGGFDIITDPKTDENVGFALSIGPSIGGDYHVNETKTKTIGGPWRSIIKIIRDWLE